MNTPEQTKKFQQIYREQYLPHLHTRRTQGGRDYAKILRESNKPAQWYQASPVTRSIYFYDPNYQKYLRERFISAINNRLHLSSIQSSPRTRYTANVHNYPVQLDHLPSRLQSVPTLPPINTPKGPHEE